MKSSFRNHQYSEHGFRKLLLGLPVPQGLPVACHWSLTSNLRNRGFEAVEIHDFAILAVEMIRCDSYLTIIHSDLMNLLDSANSHRAMVINLARRFKNCGYRIWDPRKLWTSGMDLPQNLSVWTGEYTSEIEKLIISEMEVWH